MLLAGLFAQYSFLCRGKYRILFYRYRINVTGIMLGLFFTAGDIYVDRKAKLEFSVKHKAYALLSLMVSAYYLLPLFVVKSLIQP